jgi:Cu/Ag efflux protein CusF
VVNKVKKNIWKMNIWVIGLAFVLSVFLSSGVMAREYVSTPKHWKGQLEKFTGRIEKVDLTNKVVTVQSGQKTMTFSTDHKTITSDWTQKIPFSGLKEGMWTTVEYTHKGGQTVARWIDVAHSKAQLKERADVKWFKS